MLRSHKWKQLFYNLALLSGTEKIQAINQELEKFNNFDYLTQTLEEFMEEISNNDFQSTESYVHDNGFDKIVLFDDTTTKMKMRLHIWHPSLTPRVRQNVHNHRWDFSSLVLFGSVTSLIYEYANEATDEGIPFYWNRYFARGVKEHYVVEPLGQKKLVCTETQKVSMGNIYTTPNEAFHRVDVADNEMVATLVITHENVGWVTNDLFSENPFGNSKTIIPSLPFTNEEIIGKVNLVKTMFNIGGVAK